MGLCPADDIGGWAPEEHSQFVKLRERYFREGLGTRGGRETALGRMAALLPGRDLHALMRHDDWYTGEPLAPLRM
jgi:hypothetical protein